jgi:hypothetical protein
MTPQVLLRRLKSYKALGAIATALTPIEIDGVGRRAFVVIASNDPFLGRLSRPQFRCANDDQQKAHPGVG